MSEELVGLREVRWARKLARGYASRLPWLSDEMESAAMLGLTRAAASFDPGAGSSFIHHAYIRIRGHCLDVIRDHARRGRLRGRETTGLPPDLARDHRPAGAAVLEDSDAVRGMLRAYGERGEAIARYYLGELQTMRAVGREIGVSQARASAIHMEILADLRERLSARGGAA